MKQYASDEVVRAHGVTDDTLTTYPKPAPSHLASLVTIILLNDNHRIHPA